VRVPGQRAGNARDGAHPETRRAPRAVGHDRRQAAPPRRAASLDAWIARIANARPLDELGALLAGAGLVVEHGAHHDAALEALIDRAEARLRLARALKADLPAALAGSVERALEIAAAAREALGRGALGYAVVIARRP
jgi:hypothetical protein